MLSNSTFSQLLLLLSLSFFTFFSCKNSSNPSPSIAATSVNAVQTSNLEPVSATPPLDKIRLPKGFHIDFWASDVKNARAMALSPKGTLFVGSRKEGKVYALRDTNGDHKADVQYVLMQGLDMPTGLAFRDGSLFVADIGKIYRLDNIENLLSNPPKAVLVTDKFPNDEHHGWKYIAFGPDGKLYVPVGAPCNVCEKTDNKMYASICRMDADGSNIEVVQSGIRNTVGFTWQPGTNALWFTDNGRDWMGDDMPACELNYAPKENMHFGFPYCHQGDTPDPKYGKKRPCSEFTPPAQKLGAHVAPLGLEFCLGKMFPAAYKNRIFIAEHGSWNRTDKSGYRISMVTVENGKCSDYKPFAEGWLDAKGEVWGRPVDIEWMPDGSMLVSDDENNCIYRISY